MLTKEVFVKRNIWNFAFSVFFTLVFIVMSVVVANGYLARAINLSLTEYTLLALAVFRTIRLFVYDSITQPMRDMFLKVKLIKGKIKREKYDYGFLRSISDIFSCPWCLGVWSATIVTFLYLLFPSYFFFFILVMALSGVASFLQLLTNLIGWHAEAKKIEVQGK